MRAAKGNGAAVTRREQHAIAHPGEALIVHETPQPAGLGPVLLRTAAPCSRPTPEGASHPDVVLAKVVVDQIGNDRIRGAPVSDGLQRFPSLGRDLNQKVLASLRCPRRWLG